MLYSTEGYPRAKKARTSSLEEPGIEKQRLLFVFIFLPRATEEEQVTEVDYHYDIYNNV